VKSGRKRYEWYIDESYQVLLLVSSLLKTDDPINLPTIVVWKFDKFWPSSDFPHSERSLCLINFHSNICVSHMLKCIFKNPTARARATGEHYRSSKLNVLGVWQFRHTGVTSNLAVRWQRVTANKALGGARETLRVAFVTVLSARSVFVNSWKNHENYSFKNLHTSY